MMDPIIEAVLDSRRLTFEDETTIRHQLSSLKAPTLLARACSTGPGVAASAILCTTGGLLLFHTVSTSSVAIQKIQPTLGKIFSIAAGITGIAMCVRRLSEKSLIHQVKDLLELLHETSSLARKASKWVLDNEVLERGYAMAVSRDAQSRGNVLSLKACLRLRRSAFVECRLMVFILRALSVDLLKNISIGNVLDPLENHICLIPLEEFGDSLSIPESDLEALYLATDGFCLQATKSLIGLLDLQMSELLKLLCTHHLNHVGFLWDLSLLRQLKKAHILFVKAFQRMQMEYKFETDEPVTVALRRQSAVTGNSHPPDYLRSLELHLTAALKDLRIVMIDGSATCQDTDELRKVAQQDRLEKLGYHVKCTTMLLDHLKRKSVIDDQTPTAEQSPDLSPTRSDFEIERPVVTAEDEIIIEDEIFEALVLSDAEAEHRGEPVFSVLNHYEEQKQQSKMVLEEIKSLLSARSADWKERERKARQRKGLPILDDGQVDSPMPSTHSSVLQDNSSVVPEVEDWNPDRIFNPTDVASVAAAVGSRWRGTAELQFGSDQSDSE